MRWQADRGGMIAVVAASLLPVVAARPGRASAQRGPTCARRSRSSPRPATFIAVASLVAPKCSPAGDRRCALGEILPGLAIAFEVEPLGLLFALIASGLWFVSGIYSIGYMRGNEEAHQTRFYVCFALAIAAAHRRGACRQPAHAVPLLRGAHVRHLSAGDAPRRRQGAARRAHVPRAAAALVDAVPAARDDRHLVGRGHARFRRRRHPRRQGRAARPPPGCSRSTRSASARRRSCRCTAGCPRRWSRRRRSPRCCTRWRW